jgi:hypothetical protein
MQQSERVLSARRVQKVRGQKPTVKKKRGKTKIGTGTPRRWASMCMRCRSSSRTPLAAARSISCPFSASLSVPANFSCTHSHRQKKNTHTHTHTHTYTHTRTHTHTHTHAHTCIYIYIYTYVHRYIHVYICVCVCVCVCVLCGTYICIANFACTHRVQGV